MKHRPVINLGNKSADADTSALDWRSQLLGCLCSFAMFCHGKKQINNGWFGLDCTTWFHGNCKLVHNRNTYHSEAVLWEGRVFFSWPS